MSEFNINIPGGESRRLKTAGKYCPADILVTAEGSGGIQLPELSNPGAAGDLMAGKQLIDGEGKVVDGTFTIAEELSDQNSLIAQIQEALQGKAAGGAAGDPDLPAGYRRADFIQFSGEQIVDTGIICNQNTKIRMLFTRDSDESMYMYGVVSTGNTASVTAYMTPTGGSWRFGDKYSPKDIVTNEELVQTAIVDKTGFIRADDTAAISKVNDFETIGSLLIGGVRNADGTISAPQFVGKSLLVIVLQGDEQVLKLAPVTDGKGVYRFWNPVEQKFHDSITDTPLDGGYF